MATFRKTPAGKWRAEISRGGKRTSKVFTTKQAAKDWAARTEHTILNETGNGETSTFAAAMQRYAREVSPTKRGEMWESRRIKKFCEHEIASINMRDLRPADFAKWRDQRCREVAGSTVSREMTLMSAILHLARREWGLLDVSPLTDVRKPTSPPPRDRRVTEKEMEALAFSAGDDLRTLTARAFHAFRFAIETAMRAGEIVGLRPQHIDLVNRVATLPKTKNGSAREVPLSSEAVRLIEALPAADPVFGLTSAQLDALWRKMRDKALVTGLTFHDSRHEAISRLAGKLEVLDLAKMVGHKDLNQLLVYYNTTAAELAKKLD